MSVWLSMMDKLYFLKFIFNVHILYHILQKLVCDW